MFQVVSERTVVNNRETDLERRQRTGNELKDLGNKHFKAGEWAKAKEMYTSSICEYDQNPVVFTNRAQAEVRLGEFFAAQKDCEAAIKLKPDYTKAYVHLAKALKGLKEDKQAIEVLNIAESISQDTIAVIQKYKDEIRNSS